MLAFASRIIRGDAYNNNVKHRCVVACFERGASNVIDSFFHSHRYHRFCRGSRGGAQMREHQGRGIVGISGCIEPKNPGLSLVSGYSFGTLRFRVSFDLFKKSRSIGRYCQRMLRVLLCRYTQPIQRTIALCFSCASACKRSVLKSF